MEEYKPHILDGPAALSASPDWRVPCPEPERHEVKPLNGPAAYQGCTPEAEQELELAADRPLSAEDFFTNRRLVGERSVGAAATVDLDGYDAKG